jgi:hypothetical protein
VPQGGACADDAQCATLVCAQGVCCDRACDGTGERCDLAASRGTCAAVAAAVPAASNTTMVVAVALLVLIAARALLHLRTRARRPAAPD